MTLTPAERAAYRRHGYHLAPGLFSPAETASLRRHYMRLRRAGSYAGDSAGVAATAADPLLRYPRMIHMHRWDRRSREWLLAPRLAAILRALLGSEPLAVQTMLYFKPPGARGQALHQDQFYLKARPGTCMAAWLALDDSDEENGCLQVAPGTQDLPVLCPERADTTVSFTDVTVPLPPGMAVRPVPMAAGDVLFFNGSLVHGSLPNTSRRRFRRALIGHYLAGVAAEVAAFYHPVLRMDGTDVPLAVAAGGGRCGVWRDRDGKPAVELVASAPG